ncbi:carbohydrate ABC transporter permease [Dictyobacter aurantiacus]|uniref:Sugar ABC transporter permease n=1 Tax=Dictyobacter aurantiacus TaxID=1936993 RepID=A0A401ZR94_9CHLR|nr:sugar ABC transporter permease [Dictyobacter aurantiacus]GCE09395.1 sugar ABC transporter permease [Dictyobacter aurantiacus]
MNPFGGKRTWWVPYLGMLPGVALFVLFSLGPSLSTAVLSLTDISGVPNVPWHFIGLQNYIEYFSSGSTRDNLAALERTIIFCVSVTIIQNTLALGVAILLNTKLPGHTFVRSVIFMPVVLGVTVIGLIWSLMFDPTGGPIALLLGHFGITSSFFGDNTLAFPLVIGVQIWSALGYSMIIFLAGLQTVPPELGEAAVVDGASIWQRFRNVTYPLLAPSVTINMLLGIIGSLQTYQLIYVLTGGNFNTSVLSYQIFSNGFSQTQRQGYASALAMLQFVLVAAVALIALAYFRRKEVQL